MKRSVRLTFTLSVGALVVGWLVTLVWLAISGAAPALPADTPTPFTVPTISAGSSGVVTPAAPPTAGVTLAYTLTCVTTIIGLIITVVTLAIMLRGGYGPFLRALFFGGKRRGKKHVDEAASEDDGAWDASHTLRYRPGPDAREEDVSAFAEDDAWERPAAARRSATRSRGGSRSRGEERDPRRADRARPAGAPIRRDGASARRAQPRRRDNWE